MPLATKATLFASSDALRRHTIGHKHPKISCNLGQKARMKIRSRKGHGIILVPAAGSESLAPRVSHRRHRHAASGTFEACRLYQNQGVARKTFAQAEFFSL